MRWGRRGRLLVGALLACLFIPLLGGQAAWAGTVTDSHTGWSFVTLPSDGVSTSQSVTVSQPGMMTGDLQRSRVSVCGAADGTGTQTQQLSAWVTWTYNDAASLPTIACTAPAVLMAYRIVVASARGTYTVLQWQATNQSQTGTTVSGPASSSPSPYPSPVVTPSPYPVPGPTETWYAYPTPQAGGGGDVDGCAVDTCTVTLAAGSEVGLSPSQWTVLCLFLAVILIVGLSGFVVRHSKPWRVAS